MAAATLLVSLAAWITVGMAQPPAESVPEEPAPPAGQSYTGAKKCSSCHFEQYMAWKKTNHAKSFELLPAKYQKDAKCLACHTTGYGRPTGFKALASDANLAGTTCEACHGPGSEHEEVCKAYAQKKKLTPEEEKLARDSIWKILPGNACTSCHKVQGHHPSETPKELQTKK
jgi:hypothetical protein